MEAKLKKNIREDNNPEFMKKEITELRAFINNEKQREDHLKNKLEALQFEVSTLKGEIDQAELKKNIAKKKFNSLENSHSWRITKPLRWINKILMKNTDQKVKHTGVVIESKNEMKHIRDLREKLYCFGFNDRAIGDLHDLVNGNIFSPRMRRLAAWELSKWYVNQLTPDGAEKCLELLPVALNDVVKPERIYLAAIIEAECFKVLNKFDDAKKALRKAFIINEDPNIYLASANFEENSKARLNWINKALDYYELPKISLNSIEGKKDYDCLSVSNVQSELRNVDKPKITVIMPVYNAQDVITTALESVINQTWDNLEIIIVDDCSTDSTAQIIEKYMSKDARIRFLKQEENKGAYTARNLALQIATGEFVTCHDADDWSHPLKVELQALHLMSNKRTVGNTSQAARITEELMFYRRGKLGHNIFPNISSLMFRREIIKQFVGYWDSVRFSADSEFISRIKIVFGVDAIIDLHTGPLSFPRISSGSLTSDEKFGLNGSLYGARRVYRDNYLEYHSKSESLKYDFPQENRPFVVPEPMMPTRGLENRFFDVIFVTDFRNSNVVMQMERDIGICIEKGLSVGILQMNLYNTSPETRLDPKINILLNRSNLHLIVYGEVVYCRHLILRYCLILGEHQKYIPVVVADNLHMILGEEIYKTTEDKINKYNTSLKRYFGLTGTWYPVDNKVKKKFLKIANNDSKNKLASTSWIGVENLENSR
ncbi:hypothetical protein JCM10914A_14750 [Paenibacillus sp. JCM 10914]|uniref:glycosyltransferase family 2 protein n=1 Tax=Paenibacillus sp. JCM 10914 TaxID=1236974 RepID=UPI0003CCB979|nr:glycosyltransferase family 2 protein [Paenibacillus sp. JCM 10914]GAE09676.1 glycosyl transferase family protein [Paenibacillus sp. JCM 10914]